MKVFFIGICGVSMSCLAYLMSKDGFEVEGSDINIINPPKCLSEINIHKQPYLQGIEWADIVVVSSAIKENEEVQLAKILGKDIVSRGEMLGFLASEYEKVIAIAGSHGKTTTTAMIFHALWVNGRDPTLHLGGDLKGIGNIYIGGREFFVTEACEYCDNFLYLYPYLSVITNIEPEHLDYFKTFNNELKSFKKFEENSLFVIKKTEYEAKNVRINKGGRVSFSVYKNGIKIDRLTLKIGGKYNAYNAIYCIEACEKLGLKFKQIKFALETFEGVRKRCERRENSLGLSIFVDYAHHPKEIKESAKYFKQICKRKCIVIFQPHTYSRTKKFFHEFISSLSIFDEIICYKTYPAREDSSQGLSERDLYFGLLDKGKKVYHAETEEELRDILKNYRKEDLIAFLGAGDLPDKFDFSKQLT